MEVVETKWMRPVRFVLQKLVVAQLVNKYSVFRESEASS